MTGPSVRASAYYSAPVDRFLTTEPYHVLGALAAAHSHDLDVEQRQAWEEELLVLKAALTALTGTLFLEFDVPRLGSRIDAVLISGPAVFPIEFKCWDADLRRHADSWRYQSFRGDAWTTIHKGDRKRYLLNAYRVLLTRARRGMIVFVPPGDPSDPTRAPSFYDDTYQYLVGLGVADV